MWHLHPSISAVFVVLHLSIIYFLFCLKRLSFQYIYPAPHTLLGPIVNLILQIFYHNITT